MNSQHIDDDGQHIEKLDRRLRELAALFTSLGDTSDIDEVITIIHKPGWTTLPEMVLMNTLVDAVQSAAVDAQHLRAGLRDGAVVVLGETLS